MDADSDFICFSKGSRGPIERILVGFGKMLESGVFEQAVSVNASKHLFCVTVVCTKNKNEGARMPSSVWRRIDTAQRQGNHIHTSNLYMA